MVSGLVLVVTLLEALAFDKDYISPALARDDCRADGLEDCHLSALQRRLRLQAYNLSNISASNSSAAATAAVMSSAKADSIPPVPEVPATEAPATEAPATEAPATEAPTTEAPATEAPATEAPTPEAPVTEAPASNGSAQQATPAPAGANSTAQPAAQPVSACLAGQEIPFSNRGPDNKCFASKLGDECDYTCDAGYIGVGRHACQTIIIQDKVWKNQSFFGGNCWRLCPSSSSPCPAGQVPLRSNTTDDLGPCMQTKCMTADDALKNVARGNYEVWRRSRNNFSGCYTDHIDLDTGKAKLGSSDTTGMGLVVESVAHAMGWISSEEYVQRVNRTFTAFLNIHPPATDGFWKWNFTRGPKGWVPRYFEETTGALLAEAGDDVDGVWSVMSTGLFYVGVLFVQTYMLNDVYMQSQAAGNVVRMSEELMDLVDWHSMLCLQAYDSTEVVEGYNGTGIPMLMNNKGQCSGIMWPEADGYYPFTEEITAAWIADRKVCGQRGQENCSMPAIHTMWNRVIGRATHPNIEMFGHPLLSDWSSYVLQIPYYTTHPVNSFPAFQSLFKSGWLADWANYNSSVFYGGSNRYGMGAGPDIQWCSGSDYNADKYTDNPRKADCRTWSPEAVAGWLPAAPEVIKGHLLEMMANGESVLPVPGTDYHILWRKAMVDPGKNWSNYVTLIDLSTELLGLSTLWLGQDFYSKHTNHFTRVRGYIPEVPIR